MRQVSVADLDPTVRVANWHDPPQGATWGPRIIEDPELVLVLAGRLRYRVGKGPWIHAGERTVLFIPPGIEHDLEQERSPGTISCWHGELVPDAVWADGDYLPAVSPPPVTPIGDHPFLVAAFRKLSETYAGYGGNRLAVMRDLVRLIWTQLMEIWQQSDDTVPRRLEPMLAWVRERLDRPVGRNQVAHQFGLTPQHVNALFRQGLGTTPGEFVRRERVLRAWHDIHAGGLSVSEAAVRWGFRDPFHFSRVFRKVMGFPPSRAR